MNKEKPGDVENWMHCSPRFANSGNAEEHSEWDIRNTVNVASWCFFVHECHTLETLPFSRATSDIIHLHRRNTPHEKHEEHSFEWFPTWTVYWERCLVLVLEQLQLPEINTTMLESLLLDFAQWQRRQRLQHRLRYLRCEHGFPLRNMAANGHSLPL